MKESKAQSAAQSALSRIKAPTIAQIKDQMINGIGIEVGWRFSGARLTPSQLRTRAAAAGLDPDTIKDIDPVAGLKRAVGEWKRKDGRTTIVQAEITLDSPDEVVVGLLYHTRQGDRQVAKLQRELIAWDVAAKQWKVEGTSDEAGMLRDRVAHRQSFYDGNDVRDLLIMPALRDAQVVPSRRGSYYVAMEQLPKIEALEAALDGLEGFKFEPIGVESGQGGDARMARAAVTQIGDSLAQLEDQIEGWIDAPRAPGTNTEAHVFGRFDELHSMAKLYEENLEIKLHDLRDLIDEMRQTARERITDKREQSKERAAQRRKGEATVDRRAKLDAMEPAKLATIWAFKIGNDQPMPTDRNEMLDRLTEALQANA